jgi:hypothetical protein
MESCVQLQEVLLRLYVPARKLFGVPESILRLSSALSETCRQLRYLRCELRHLRVGLRMSESMSGLYEC